MAYTEVEADLLPEELKKAKINLIGVLIFMLIFFAFVKFFFWDNLISDVDEMLPLIMFGVFFLFFFAILGFIMKGFILDFVKKKKLILTGTVTDKRIDISTHRSGGSGRGGSSRSSTKRTYYLYFDEKQLSVNINIYNRTPVGSEVEIHYSKYSQSIFSDKIIAEAEVSEEKIKAIVPDVDKDQNFVPKERELQMTKDDFELLKKARNREIKSRLIVFFILGWVVIGPLFSGFWLVTIMLFPFTIWWFMVVKKMIKYMLAYRNEVNSGLKIVYSELVLDRFRQTGNTRGFMVRTNNQLISVNEDSYEQLKIGDLIIVFKGKATGWIFGFMTSDNQFYEVKADASLKKKSGK
ncbi:hypothetical protein [Roseivirga echinicomitans]|uniref:Uncharacterized protein n=1 Tax=Roseivirga echinicomitans TaxID=296218 RepID=A0A150X9U3_9BACT|nr:hypothetical protein [Roseivirga echinicomitans]KYG75440.1 hypothetical protein AWN68_07800 [Roseivirga echinicomitans]